MNVLVIGGAGYIGSHVVQRLLDNGHSVKVYDNMSSGRWENLFPDAAFVMGDILDYPRLSETMRRGCDACIHLAAFKAAGESMLVPEKYSVNNISGTINILNALAANGIERLVFSSTAAVYGDPQYVPMDEAHPVNPANYYGFTKLEIERFLGWYDRLKGLRYAALRYFNAAGYDPQGRIRGLEINPANLLPVVMEVAAGMRKQIEIFGDDYDTRDGTCIRDYVHVSDLADAHVAALDYLERENKSLIANLGTEMGATVSEVVAVARRITGRQIPSVIVARRPGDPGVVLASSARAKLLLGWEASRSDIDSIVESTWRVYSSYSAGHR
jgi:UDP-glucose 4-epimerase